MAYCAVSDVKDYGGWDSDAAADDVLIADLIARAKGVIEAYTHRRFEVSGATTRYFDAEDDVEDATLWLDDDLIPVASDITVTNGDATTIASSDYVFEPRNRTPAFAIKLKGSSGKVWQNSAAGDPENAISVSGKWAFSASCPADITHATVRLVSWLYKQRETDAVLDRPLMTPQGLTIMPSQLPRDVTSILDVYRHRRIG